MSILSESVVSIGQAEQVIAGSILTGQIPQKPNVASVVYSYNAIGGSISLNPYVLTLSKPIPKDSAVVRVSIVPTGVVGGVGYNYSLGLNTTNDVVNAGTLAANSLLSTNIRAATDIYQVKFSIAGAAITAGSVNFQFIYM